MDDSAGCPVPFLQCSNSMEMLVPGDGLIYRNSISRYWSASTSGYPTLGLNSGWSESLFRLIF